MISLQLLIVFLFHSLDRVQYHHIPLNYAASNQTQKCSQIPTKHQRVEGYFLILVLFGYLYLLLQGQFLFIPTSLSFVFSNLRRFQSGENCYW